MQSSGSVSASRVANFDEQGKNKAKQFASCSLPGDAIMADHPLERTGMSETAQTPEAPYYAVIFTSLRPLAESPEYDAAGYDATAEQMLALARTQPGFLGVESARGEDGLGITVSYWDSMEAIRSWRGHEEHRLAQDQGRAKWYRYYHLRVCRVERAMEFSATGHCKAEQPEVSTAQLPRRQPGS